MNQIKDLRSKSKLVLKKPKLSAIPKSISPSLANVGKLLMKK